MIDVSLRYKFYGVNETYECRMFDFIHHMIRVVVLVIFHPGEKVSQLKLRTGNYDESCRITGKTSLSHRFMKIAQTHWAASSIIVLLRKIKPIRIYKIYGSNHTSSAQITAARRMSGFLFGCVRKVF